MNNEETILSNDEEKLFNIIDAGRIDDFIDVLFQLKKPFILNTKKLIKTFESNYFSHIKEHNYSEKIKTLKEVTRLSMLYPELLSKKFTKQISTLLMTTYAKLADIEKNIKRKNSINNELMSIISLNQENLTSKRLLKSCLKNQPESVANACEEDISIKTNTAPLNTPQVTSIYNSPIEESFDLALIKCFKEMRTVPNAPLSNIISFESIKPHLNTKQQDYFLRTSIDNVIYKDNIPIFFFEIDSSFHDDDYVKVKDKDKDFFCEISGIKLIRIRPEHPNQTSVDDFIRIVKTCMNKHIS